MPERGIPTLMADFMAFQSVNLVPGPAVAPVSLVGLALGRTSWSKTAHTGG